MAAGGAARVGLVVGSASDLATVEPALEVLRRFGVGHELRVLSAHRTPRESAEYAASARGRGLV